LNRIDDTRIGSAAAQVSFHVFHYLRAGWLRVLEQQFVAFQKHAWSAVAALDGPVPDKSFLQWVKLSVCGQALDGKNVLAGYVFDRIPAGSDGFLPNNNRTGTALVVAAAEFCSCQAEVCAQNPQQRSLAICGNTHRTSVEIKTNGRFHLSSSLALDDTILTYIRLSQRYAKL
jgi:hypothetical protein